MTKFWILLVVIGFVVVVLTARAQTGENVDVRAGINHGEYDRLLKKYVNEQGLGNYGAWKQNPANLSALDNYLKQFAAMPNNPVQGNEKVATLVTAYIAVRLRWILSIAPTESVR